jgi:hypothetical protein
VYEIEENPNLQVGSEIENTANIYFDFNPAIVTNTTYNINAYPLNIKQNEMEDYAVFPNPARETISVQGEGIVGIQIFDLSGKLVIENTSNSGNSISVSDLTTGLYTIKIETIHGTMSTKLSITH